MNPAPPRREGHLVVAAIRVLEHLRQHPPTDAEIGELLGWHEERVRVLTRGLAGAGILSFLESPYDLRYQITDHARLDELDDAEDVAETFNREMAEFEAGVHEEQERLEKLFGVTQEKEARRRKERTGLEDDFGKFKRDKPVNPFGED